MCRDSYLFEPIGINFIQVLNRFKDFLQIDFWIRQGLFKLRRQIEPHDDSFVVVHLGIDRFRMIRRIQILGPEILICLLPLLKSNVWEILLDGENASRHTNNG